MMNTETVIKSNYPDIPDHWREFANAAVDYMKKQKSDSTKACYKSDFSLFVKWCETVQAVSLPAMPIVVCMYIAHLANDGKKTSTIERRLSAIRFAHKIAGYPTPTTEECVIAAMDGIRNVKGSAPKKKAAALVWHVEAMIKQCPDTLIGIRDRALLAICLAGGFRGSEPLSLNIEDLERVPEGFVVFLKKSKTDQAGRGKKKGIINGEHIRCADLLREWIVQLNNQDIVSGAVFRPVLKNGNIETNEDRCRLGWRSFYNLLKRYAKQAGFDHTLFGTHSLRRGFVSEAFGHNAPIEDTMGVTGHESYDQVLGYKQEMDIFRNNPGRLFL